MSDVSEALDMQTRLVRDWPLHPEWTVVVNEAGRFGGDTYKIGDVPIPLKDQQLWMTTGLRQAPCFVITGGMVDVIESIASSMPSESFEEEDVFCDKGFVVLGRPVQEFWALQWQWLEDRMWVHGYYGSPLQPGRAFLIGLGMPDTKAEPEIAFLHALWRLIEQRLLVADKERVARGAARRAKASGIEVGDVRIVTLRKRESRHGEGDRIVDWTHRWMVAGHWRNQWYPRRKMHRQLWIHDYIKGPEDKPLVLKKTVYKVSR